MRGPAERAFVLAFALVCGHGARAACSPPRVPKMCVLESRSRRLALATFVRKGDIPMIRRTMAAVIGVFISCAVLLAQGAPAEKGKAAPKPAGKKAVFSACRRDEVGGDARSAARRQGRGPVGRSRQGPLRRHPGSSRPGFSAPLHTHSSDMHAVVVSGTFVVGPEGGPENRLPAGSYEFIPSTYRDTRRGATPAPSASSSSRPKGNST